MDGTSVRLLLDTHAAPTQLGTWRVSREWAFEVRLDGLPKDASWLEQVEILFSTVQRELLMPSDFPRLAALARDLAASFADLNTHPKPIKGTDTKTQLLAKFEVPPPLQLAA